MRFVAGGTFRIGSDDHYPEEGPAHLVRVDSFWIDETPVTNAEFAQFVEVTGYTTLSERAPDPALYPGIQPDMILAGSLVFDKPAGPVPMHDYTAWWSYRAGADWRHPLGPDSSIAELEDHPVVHIAHEDAAVYAAWAGKSLPSEAEWEFAARGAGPNQPYAWGDALAPGGAMLANYWQGQFPWENTALDGFERTSPVRSFPPNGFGLYDMIGNVWEWTDDWFGLYAGEQKEAGASCCIPANPRGGRAEASLDPCQPEIVIGRKVLKGGSHLCAENYCQRYRPAARYAQPVDTSTCHVGFRCVVRHQPT